MTYLKASHGEGYDSGNHLDICSELNPVLFVGVITSNEGGREVRVLRELRGAYEINGT